MIDLQLKLENFLSIKKANVESKNNITVLIAPNRAGKTQLMLLLYSILWSLWKEQKDKKGFITSLPFKLRNVYLLKSLDDVIKWDKKTSTIKLNSSLLDLSYIISGNLRDLTKNIKVKEMSFNLKKSPVYLQLAGLGDYYKGIYSLNKYYPHWKLISEAVTDLLTDLFIVSTEKAETEKENKELLGLFEKLFTSKFYIQNDRIYIQEKNRKYGIEKTASGLKSLSWFYLILRYNLAGKFLFIDEPEVNLHPAYIDKLAYFLYKLSQNRKIFIATHSDYLLESFNKLMNKHDFKIDVWEGKLENDGAIYTSYQADKDNLIDTTPLTEVFLDILKEGFGYGKN